MSRRTLTNNKISLLLLTMLVFCSINVTPRQRLDSSHHNRTLADAPTQVSASQISGNGLIAFSAAGQIYVMNADGSDVRRLTDDTPRVLNQYPVFSPDGSHIAFTRIDESSPGEHGLYIIGIDGGRLQRIASGFTPLGEPTWSPDGSRIAFIRGYDTTVGGYAVKSTCRPEIYAIDVVTSEEVSLTLGEGGTDPAWSPDGTRIAFSSFRDGNYEIYTMDSDGKNVQRLTYTDWAEAEPAWSPSGKQIAYVAHLLQEGLLCGFIPTGRPPTTEAEPSSIYVMEADGTNQTGLEVTSGGNEPTWSPDGAWLALVLSDKNGTQIYTTDAGGNTRLIQLTSDAEEKTSPSWSNASR